MNHKKKQPTPQELEAVAQEYAKTVVFLEELGFIEISDDGVRLNPDVKITFSDEPLKIAS